VKWSCSVLCYNKPRVTAGGIESILRSAPRLEFELLITDNGSADETARIIDRYASDHRVRIIRHETNLGVIVAKNHALSQARGDYFVSLDNDCRISAGSIVAMTTPFDLDPNVAQVGRDGGFGRLSRHGVGTHGPPGYERDYIDGSCFMVRTDLAKRFGGVCDEAYTFAYCEDSDFSLRLRKAGWRITTVHADVEHLEHQTAHGAGLDLREHWKNNHRLFMSRWSGYLKTRRFGHPEEPAVPRRNEESPVC